MKNIIYILIVTLTLASCANVKNFTAFHEKHNQQASDSFNKWYPAKEKIVEGPTVYKEGEVVTLPGETQLITVNCDSAIKTVNHKVVVKVAGELRVDTIYQPIIHYQENVALEKVLTDSIANIKKTLTATDAKEKKVEKTRDDLWIALAITAVVGIVAYVIKNVKWV